MNLDFALILVLLTFGSGAIWAVDAWLFAPRRAAAGDGQPDREPVLVEYARSFFPVFLIVLVLRSFLAEPFRIPSASMMPTLVEGDFILVNKFEYGLRMPVLNTKFLANELPRRGDIVVFRYPDNPSIPFIKRVVGLPGDHILYVGKTLFINGREVPQLEPDTGPAPRPELLRRTEVLGEVRHDIFLDAYRPAFDLERVVPPGHYFVLGDNRDNSKDSRFWGFVPEENLIGHAFLIWMNLSLKNGGIEWNRIGTILH